MPRIILDAVRGIDQGEILEVLTSNGFAICERTESLCREDDMVEVYTCADQRHSENWHCDVADDEAYTCGHCGERFSDDCGNYLDCAGAWVCHCCQEDTYAACEDCGETFHNDNLEDGHCENCGNSRGLAPYHGDKVRNSWREIPRGAVGVELEMYAPSSGVRDEVASAFRALGCAVERDGSLCSSRGMEIITPPRTLGDTLDTLRAVCATAKANGLIGQPRGNLGYGIHVNLDCRGMDYDSQGRFCDVFSKVNQGWLEIVAGRKECHWSKYKADIDGGVPCGKYDAAGCKGSRLEVRVFRSTNFLNSVLGFVTLCDDLRRYAMGGEDSQWKGAYADSVLKWLGEFGAPETIAMLERKLQARNAEPRWLDYLKAGIARRPLSVNSVDSVG